jgi:hypothetical protein
VLGEELQEVNKPNEDKTAMAQTALLHVFSRSIGPSSGVLSSRMPRDAVTGPLFIYILQTDVEAEDGERPALSLITG